MSRVFERRVFGLRDAQVVRASDQSGKLTFRGRPWVYGQLSEDMGGWQEVIRPGAATRTLAAEPDVRFLINHDANLLLSRTSSGTLSLSEDDDGGLAVADMADVSYARDLATLIERGDLNQMSFGFWVTRDSWSGNLHQVEEFDLDGGDVSAVTFPAFPQTSVEIRDYAKRNLNLADVADAPIIDLTPSGVRGFLESITEQDCTFLPDSFPELRLDQELSDEHAQLVRAAIEALESLTAAGEAAGDDGYLLERAKRRLHDAELVSAL